MRDTNAMQRGKKKITKERAKRKDDQTIPSLPYLYGFPKVKAAGVPAGVVDPAAGVPNPNAAGVAGCADAAPNTLPPVAPPAAGALVPKAKLNVPLPPVAGVPAGVVVVAALGANEKPALGVSVAGVGVVLALAAVGVPNENDGFEVAPVVVEDSAGFPNTDEPVPAPAPNALPAPLVVDAPPNPPNAAAGLLEVGVTGVLPLSPPAAGAPKPNESFPGVVELAAAPLVAVLAPPNIDDGAPLVAGFTGPNADESELGV